MIYNAIKIFLFHSTKIFETYPMMLFIIVVARKNAIVKEDET